MSTPAQLGKYEWRSQIEHARDANTEMRNLLRKIIKDGSPLVQAYAGQAALVVMDNENALNRLEEIGRNTRNQTAKNPLPV